MNIIDTYGAIAAKGLFLGSIGMLFIVLSYAFISANYFNTTKETNE